MDHTAHQALSKLPVSTSPSQFMIILLGLDVLISSFSLLFFSAPIQKNEGCNHISCKKVSMSCLEWSTHCDTRSNIKFYFSVVMTFAGSVLTRGVYTTTELAATLRKIRTITHTQIQLLFTSPSLPSSLSVATVGRCRRRPTSMCRRPAEAWRRSTWRERPWR